MRYNILWSISSLVAYWVYTLKTPGSNGVKRVHWGQTPFRVNDDPAISQLDVEYDPELGQSDPIIGQVCRKLTKFWAIFYTEPQWILFWAGADLAFFPRGGGFDPTTMRSIVHEPADFLLFWTPISDVFLASTNAMETIVHEPQSGEPIFLLFLNPRKWCFPGIY